MTDLFLPDLVIFDCDGTLVDSYESTRTFYNSIRAALGLKPMNLEEEQYTFVQTIPKGIQRIIPPELQEKAFEEVAATDWEKFIRYSRLQKGVLEFILFLQERGVARAVNTNSGDEVRVVLQTLEVQDRFDLVISADDVERPKPDPEGALFILERLKVKPGRAVYIGDSIIDQQTARAAGVAFWAYGSPELEADLHVRDYGELKDSLGG